MSAACLPDVYYEGDLARMMSPVSLSGKYAHEKMTLTVLSDKKSYRVTSGDEYEKFRELASRIAVYPDQSGIYRNDDIDGKRVLLFADSMLYAFTESMLAENFSELVMLWTYSISQEAIDLFKPDIVIMDVSERRINYTLGNSNLDFISQ